MHVAVILYLYSSREEATVLDLGIAGKGEVIYISWNTVLLIQYRESKTAIFLV
jgi:hypothetical protein